LHSEKLRGWNSIERDMRMAGYTQEEIEMAKLSFYQGITLLIRIFQSSQNSHNSLKSREDIQEN
jgi:hypothetical protein